MATTWEVLAGTALVGNPFRLQQMAWLKVAGQNGK
jgi:hypothetical protein